MLPGVDFEGRPGVAETGKLSQVFDEEGIEAPQGLALGEMAQLVPQESSLAGMRAQDEDRVADCQAESARSQQAGFKSSGGKHRIGNRWNGIDQAEPDPPKLGHADIACVRHLPESQRLPRLQACVLDPGCPGLRKGKQLRQARQQAYRHSQ